MRLKAGIVAAVLSAGTMLICVGPAGAQQSDGPNCEDFPTQIDIPNSILGDLDPTDLDANDDGVGCESNAGPPKAYDLTKVPPVAREPEPEPEPEPQPEPQPAPTPEPAATPAQPVTAEPDFTG
jgi:outer membrane biosynthesis protein TonB